MLPKSVWLFGSFLEGFNGFLTVFNASTTKKARRRRQAKDLGRPLFNFRPRTPKEKFGNNVQTVEMTKYQHNFPCWEGFRCHKFPKIFPCVLWMAQEEGPLTDSIWTNNRCGTVKRWQMNLVAKKGLSPTEKGHYDMKGALNFDWYYDSIIDNKWGSKETKGQGCCHRCFSDASI